MRAPTYRSPMLNSSLRSFQSASSRLKFQAGFDCSRSPEDMASVKILLFNATCREENKKRGRHEGKRKNQGGEKHHAPDYIPHVYKSSLPLLPLPLPRPDSTPPPITSLNRSFLSISVKTPEPSTLLFNTRKSSSILSAFLL